mmetsp:Transcript_3903/g.8767  ORF Transcript_3903/g.8767 Transcript_3903/m.8767 type:complete len:212 (+) Transcript_3903:2418-3053(+)
MSCSRQLAASSSSSMASQPPMFAKPSFFALIVMPSHSDAMSRTISSMDRSRCPGSRRWMKKAFSANLHASMMSGLPCACASSLTSFIFSRLTGCPPAELLVTVSITHGTSLPRGPSSRLRSASTSMFPLKGCFCEVLSNVTMRSRASAPLASTCALVVSKCVLFGTTRPFPPSALNSTFSAARPWCVGSTCLNGKRCFTACSKRTKLGLPA